MISDIIGGEGYLLQSPRSCNNVSEALRQQGAEHGMGALGAAQPRNAVKARL